MAERPRRSKHVVSKGKESTSKRSRSEASKSGWFGSLSQEIFFTQVVSMEKIIESTIFDYSLLTEMGLNVYDWISDIGLAHFCGQKDGYYPDLVKIFYSGLREIRDDENNLMISSSVCGVDVDITCEDICGLFHIPPGGLKLSMIDKTVAFEQHVADLRLLQDGHIDNYDGKLVSNHLSLRMRFIHYALTHCVIPKGGSYRSISRIEKEILSYLLQGAKIDFAHLILAHMAHKLSIMKHERYASRRSMRTGLPYGSMICRILQAKGVNCSAMTFVPFHEVHLFGTTNLKLMKIYRTRFRGFVPLHHLRADDIVLDFQTGEVLPNPVTSRHEEEEQVETQDEGERETGQPSQPSSSGWERRFEERLDGFETRIEARFQSVDDRIRHIDERLDGMDGKIDQLLAFFRISQPSYPPPPPPPTEP